MRRFAFRFIHIVFFLLVILVLSVGLIKSVFSPVDEIAYENRPANKAATFSFSDYLSTAFQSSAESALADQVPLAIKSKKLYNILDTAAAFPVIRALERSGDGYIRYKNVNFYRDVLLYSPTALYYTREGLSSTAQRINSWSVNEPDTEFFAYYIETDLDISLDTGKKIGHWDYFSSLLDIPADNTGLLELNSYAEYLQHFLRTDHHWNAYGSAAALGDICSMLAVEPLTATGEHTVSGRYLGTKAAGIEGFPKEDFTVISYDLPALRVTADGVLLDDYWQQTQFMLDEPYSFSYGSVYGGDYGELIFDTGTPGENLLVMGDSYDNAIIKALSSRFARTYSVDLRAYGAATGETFDMEAYIEEHSIDKVLIIGALQYFSGAES